MRFVSRLFSRQWRLFCRDVSSYTQGQSPEARIREYFYYIDHQGQVQQREDECDDIDVIPIIMIYVLSFLKLFLDDTKVKNFVTCFKGISISVSAVKPIYL